MDEKSLKESIREEFEKLARLTWGQRFVYIWNYYKPLMCGILFIIAAVCLIRTILYNSSLNPIMQVYLLNSNSPDVNSEEISAGFAEFLGGVGEKDVITVDSSLQINLEGNSQYDLAGQAKIMALASAQDIDILIMDEKLYHTYQENGYFCDIREVLSEEQEAELSDILVYGTDLETGEECAFAVNAAGSPVLEKYHAYNEDNVYLSVAVSAQHRDLCDDFIQYLFTGNMEDMKNE